MGQERAPSSGPYRVWCASHRATSNSSGVPIKGLPINRIVSLGIAHVPEGRKLFPYLSVLANIKLGAYLRKDKKNLAADLEQGLRAISPAEGEAHPEGREA